MATKTISLSTAAYNRLRRHRRFRGESFSHVVLRARWPEEGVTAAELLERWKDEPAFFSEEELDSIDRAKADAPPPEDKWTSH